MSATKKVLIGLGVVILVAGVGVWQLFANLDAIVAGIIQSAGTEAVGTDVRVSSVKLDLKNGKATISGLTIRNPKGYTDKYIFSMDDISVGIDVSSLNKNPIVINEILVRQPKVIYELNKDNVSNMDALLKNMKSKESSDKKPAETNESGEEIKLIIKKFRFDGGDLVIKTAAAPDKNIEQKLPVIAMNNIGASKGGATVNEIATELVKKVVSQAVKSALKSGVNRALEKEKGNLLNKAGDSIKGLFK